MPPSVAQTARIFEDSDAEPIPKKRAWTGFSTSAKKIDEPNPLGERHINSPPQPRKVPLKDEPQSRPPMHKKTGSATSLKGFLLGREKSSEESTKSKQTDTKTADKPKKSKSATNLAGLLKKRSKKDLKGEAKEDQAKPPPYPSKVSTPIWAQFATQPLESEDGSKQFPSTPVRPFACATPPLTPQSYSEQHVAGQGDVKNYFDIDPELRMPQRPFLEKRGSRSSIFTEELNENTTSDTRPTSLEVSQDRPECLRQLSGESKTSVQSPLRKEGSESPVKNKSRMFDALSALNMMPRGRREAERNVPEDTGLDAKEVDSALDDVLGRYDIPQNLRDHMRNLKPEVKAGLVKGERIGSGSSTGEEKLPSKSIDIERRWSDEKDKENDGRRPRSRSRPRSRVFSISKKSKDSASTKSDESTRSRSKSRPKSVDMSNGRPLSAISNMSTTSVGSMSANDGTSTPGDFIHYLVEVQKPELVEVGKIHKLRILLRNESVQWTDSFVKKGGMDEIANLLHRIMKLEWREEHEDNLLHETLLCMKALATTHLAMQRLESMEQQLFPALLKMLFDPDRKGPAEFSTRAIVISLVFAYLAATLHMGEQKHEQRTRSVLQLMRDPNSDDEKQTLDFVSQMHTSRPYRVWCREISNVTKEVFWIFLHHMNVVPVQPPENNESAYGRKYFPTARAPHPAAPYVGGVEWEATQYLATHLDLLNGLIVSLPTRRERNQLREELKQSGFEKVMGGSLRTCKEKFYAGVHDGLRAWVAAADADGWPREDVRAGPPRAMNSPRKSPVKKKQEEVPQLKLDVGMPMTRKADDGWL